MKRLVAIAVALAAAVSLTGCNVGPNAAVVGGDTVSASTFTGLLNGMQNNDAVQCALSISWYMTWFQAAAKASTPAPVVDGVGDDTVSVGVADIMLRQEVQAALLQQGLARHHLHITAADLARVKPELESSLSLTDSNGTTITNSSGQSLPEPLSCEEFGAPTPSPAKVVAALPKAYLAFETKRLADEEVLGESLVHVTPAEIEAFYQQNSTSFQVITLNLIQVATQAKAKQIAAAIKGGASFAAEAKANSLESMSAARGGLFFSGPVATLEQEAPQDFLTAASSAAELTPGKVSAPFQLTEEPGDWFLLESPGVQTEALSSVASQIATAIASEQVQPAVDAYLTTLSKSENIAVDPRYGAWRPSDVDITLPATPPASALLNCGSNLAPLSDASPEVSPSPSPACHLAPGT